MNSGRRAFLRCSLEQYLGIVVNFLMIAVLARLLTPEEIGLAVIGLSISATLFSLREFATAEFLIQRHSIGQEDIRTAFTILMTVSFFLAGVLYLAAEPLSRFYDSPGLAGFLAVRLISALLESAALPAIALLRRDMAFGPIARIMTTGSVVTAAATILLAYLGYSYMSYAWGLLAGAATTLTLVYLVRPLPQHFLPSFASWRSVFAFGGYRGATSVVEKVYEMLPQLLLGRIMPLSAVAFYNRANAICGIPDRILLSSIFSVAFPALAARVREGSDAKAAYLLVLTYITAVYWPALVVLAITADAVVGIVLGSGWSEVTPLVRILSVAALFWFPVILTNPLLLAMGKNRDAFAAGLIARSVSAVILCSASFYGLIAIAASQFLALPFQMIVALVYAKKHVAFTWRELFAAIRPSITVTLFAVAGPLAISLTRSSGDLSLLEFGAACLLAALGWATGLTWTQHVLLREFIGPLQAVGAWAARLSAGSLLFSRLRKGAAE